MKKRFVCLFLFMLFCFPLAACKGETVTVRFDGNGGTPAVSSIETDGASAIKLPAVEREGYVFGGWFLDRDGWKQPFLEDSLVKSPISKDLTVYARWLFEVRTVTFETNGGSAVPSAESSETTGKVQRPVAPTRAGYAFGGWFSDPELAEPFDFDAPVSSDTTLYAGWNQLFTARFETNGGTAVDPVETDSLVASPESSKMFYRLEGWFTSPELGEASRAQFPFVLTENTVFYAKWTLGETEGLQFVREGDFYSVSGLTGSAQTVVVPASHQGVRVSAVAAGAFRGNADLLGVYLPSGVVKIGSEAFSDCANLETLMLPVGVTELGRAAFKNCGALTGTLTLSAGLTRIEDETFYRCGNLTGAIAIPNGVTYVGEGGFYDCKKLTGKLTIPAKTSEVGGGAFAECDGLTEVEIPAGLTNLGAQAFLGCDSLLGIRVDESNQKFRSEDGVLLTKDGGRLIAYPAGKAGAYTLPAGVATVGAYAFSDSVGLTGIVLGSVSVIEEFAFQNCGNLASVVIPDGVSRLGAFAFNRCENLKSVIVGRGVSEIEASAFRDCGRLSSVLIGAGVTSVGAQAFAGCEALLEVSLPGGLKSLGAQAFLGCKRLTAIRVGAGSGAYRSVDGVLMSDEGKTLQICPAGKSGAYIVPAEVTAIAADAFRGCANLTSVSLSSGTLSVGQNAFTDCTKLERVELSDGLTRLGDGAFDGCVKLSQITIPEGVTRIGGQTFRGCASLVEIELPAGVTQIGNQAFLGCVTLERIAIPLGVAEMGYHVFKSCGSLTIYYSETVPADWDSAWNPDGRPVLNSFS